MKPVSVVFLIISVILIILGILTCSFAMMQARVQGVQLYDTKNSDGEIENIFDFSSEEIGKIEINVADADVKIICGADNNKIEIRNFSSTGYVCQVENKALVMETGLNILSLTDLAQGEIRFKGFRYYVNELFGSDVIGRKSVNLYISDTYDIKVIDVKTTNGDITIEGSEFDADITLQVNNGNINASDVRTDSSFDASVTSSGDITLSNVVCAMSDVACESGSVKGDLTADEISVVAEKDVKLSCKTDLEEYNYDLQANDGKITIMGINLNTPHKTHNPNFSKRIQIEAKNGNIDISASKTSENQ